MDPITRLLEDMCAKGLDEVDPNPHQRWATQVMDLFNSIRTSLEDAVGSRVMTAELVRVRHLTSPIYSGSAVHKDRVQVGTLHTLVVSLLTWRYVVQIQPSAVYDTPWFASPVYYTPLQDTKGATVWARVLAPDVAPQLLMTLIPKNDEWTIDGIRPWDPNILFEEIERYFRDNLLYELGD